MKIIGFLLALTNAWAQNPLWIDLSGEWRIMADDRPEYAAVDFDDSGWNSLRGRRGNPPTLRGKYWLRKTVILPPNTDTRQLVFTLGSPTPVYEVFVEGVRIGATGEFRPSAGDVRRPRQFALPPGLTHAGEAVHIAIRCLNVAQMAPSWNMPHTNRWILSGEANAPEDPGESFITKLALRGAPNLILSGLFLLIAAFLFVTWLEERGRREVGLLSLFLLLQAANLILTALTVLADLRPFSEAGGTVQTGLLYLLAIVVFAEFVFAALQYRPQWLVATLWLPSLVLIGLFVTGQSVGAFYYGNLWAAGVAAAVIIADLAKNRKAPGGLIGNPLNWILLLMTAAWIDRFGTRLLGLGAHWEFFDTGYLRWYREQLLTLVLSSAAMIILLRGISAARRDRARLAEELEAARAAQTMLLAQQSDASELFAIDAVYQPANEVGGDFYRILEADDDARILLVGDVSGKGLKAAMLVSLLLGALRNTRERRPDGILAELNHVAMGQTGGGFVTCCCARFNADGTVAVANAGHLSPYLNRMEVATSSGLPLGIADGISYEETYLKLPCGESMMFLSDGVPEAANVAGELFGFDRTREISGKSAGDIADAAKAWGQNDDITVVTAGRIAR